MSRTLLPAVIALCFTSSAFAQSPSITPNGVINAASAAGPPGSGANVQIAQGSLAVIYGKNMGPAALVVAPSLPLSTSLSGTSVKVNSGGTGYDGYPYYTSAGQLSFVVPSTVPLGNASVTVSYNGLTSAGQAVTIVKSAFGILAKNGSGSGPAVLQNAYSGGTVKTNGLATAAIGGQVLVLYGTGLGPIASADNVPPPTANVGSNVTITVGGQVLTPSYAGRSFFPGLDQINFQLPASVVGADRTPGIPGAEDTAGASVPSGCYVPISVTTGNGASNQTTLAISSGSSPVCTHPMGLSAAALAQLDAGGTVNVGLALAARIGIGFGISADGAGAVFFAGTANDVFAASLLAANNNVSAPQHGQSGCYDVDLLAGGPSATATVSLSNLGFAHLLDAGPSLTLSGPGQTQTLTALKPGGYGAGGSFLADGNWTLSGNGGADVGAFKATSYVPVVTWTNASQFDGQAVTRGALTVNWTGGGPNTIVGIAGTSLVLDINNPLNSVDREFLCYAPASAQSFTVPASFVQALAASPASGGIATLSLSAGDAASFTAPLTKGGQLDGGIFGGAVSDIRGVTWK